MFSYKLFMQYAFQSYTMLFSDCNVWRHARWIQGLSKTWVMKFNDFKVPVLFSSTFKALNLGEKIQVLSSTFKDVWEPW